MAATSEAASVEFTSPGTSTTSGVELEQKRLEPLHHSRRLLGMRARPDIEHVIRLADPQLLEEHARHGVVVMLAGVHEHVLEGIGTPRELGDDRGGLHEVRPGSDDREDLQRRAHTGAENR